MTQTEDLYALEQLDLAIENDEAKLADDRAKLGDRKVLDAAQRQVEAAKQDLQDRHSRHRAAEAEVDDITAKIESDEQKLYSGTIFNPKELNSLQHEVTLEKARRDELENAALEIIEGVEKAEANVARMTATLQKLENDWLAEQERLKGDIERLTVALEKLHQDRDAAAAKIDRAALDLYGRIRQQKKPAVTRVERGICQCCRVSPSVSALQHARGGQADTCSCGRILYVA
jgi:predicted  nucleic acid-binding Zn-ribbon protein